MYFLGDDASISWGSLMRTKHLSVLIHILNKDEVGTKILTFRGGASFVDHICYLCFMFATLYCLFIEALWLPAGKGLTSRLICMRCFLVFCHFPMWCPGSSSVFDFIDS